MRSTSCWRSSGADRPARRDGGRRRVRRAPPATLPASIRPPAERPARATLDPTRHAHQDLRADGGPGRHVVWLRRSAAEPCRSTREQRLWRVLATCIRRQWARHRWSVASGTSGLAAPGGRGQAGATGARHRLDWRRVCAPAHVARERYLGGPPAGGKQPTGSTTAVRQLPRRRHTARRHVVSARAGGAGRSHIRSQRLRHSVAVHQR